MAINSLHDLNRADPLEAALFYAKNGIAVAPVQPKTKSKFYYYPEYPGNTSEQYPNGNPYSWSGQATTDLNIVRRFWTEHPEANICAAMGNRSKNIFTIDYDVKEDGNGFDSLREWERKNNAHLPKTISMITGSGGEQHFYIGNGQVNKAEGLYDFIDIRANGAFTILPPSIHPNGKKYQWELDSNDLSDMVEANDIVYEFLKVKTKQEHSSYSKEAASPDAQNPNGSNERYKLPDRITKGRRNNELSRLSASLRGQGFSKEICAAAVKEANNKNCVPPLDNNEVEKIIQAAYETEKLKLPKYAFRDSQGRIKINCPLLAQYIESTLPYCIVRERGKNSFQIYVYEKYGVYNLYSSDMFKGIIKSYISRISPGIVRICDVEETYKNIITELNFTLPEHLNNREDLINFENGFVQIKQNEIKLIPHSANIYSTIQIPAKWEDRQTDTPIFDNYIHTLTNGNKAIEDLILEFIGACISNVKMYRMKKSLFMYGPGDTGKSQLKSLIEKILGNGNYAAIDLPELEARFGTSSVYGKRLAGSSDMTFATVREMKIFKKLTGGDSIDVEFKGQDSFSYVYNGALWFCMNKLIKFGGDNGQWVYDRIIPIKCTNVIPKDQQDKQLLEKMYAERQGIIHKSIIALQRVIRNGYTFSEPKEIIAERQLYIEKNSTAICFFRECMTEREAYSYSDLITTSKIYKVYAAWCKDTNSGYILSQLEFREAISQYLNSPWEDLTKRNSYGIFLSDWTLTEDIKRTYKYELS